MQVVDMRPHTCLCFELCYPCVQGCDHICCVTLRWLGFLYCPHKPESVREVSKQGLYQRKKLSRIVSLPWSVCCSGLCCVTRFNFTGLVLLVGVEALLTSVGKYCC